MFIYYIYLGKYFVIHFAPAFTNLQHFPYIFNKSVPVFRFCFGSSVYLGTVQIMQKSVRWIASGAKLLQVVFFNSKELSILLQFVNLTCFSYILICVNFSPSDCRLTAIFMGKLLILYEISVT